MKVCHVVVRSVGVVSWSTGSVVAINLRIDRADRFILTYFFVDHFHSC